MKVRLLFSAFLLLVPGVAQAGHRRTSDFSATVARSATYEVAIRDAAARYSVDPRLLWTVAYLESRFRPRLVSRKGARGMMQFMPATGRRYGLLTLRDFHDPIRSIEAAAMYLGDLNAMFSGRIELILAGYNAGENAVIASGCRVPRYHETRSYVSRGVSVFRSLTVGRVSSNQIPKGAQISSMKPSIYWHPIGQPKQRPLSRVKTAQSIYFSSQPVHGQYWQ